MADAATGVRAVAGNDDRGYYFCLDRTVSEDNMQQQCLRGGRVLVCFMDRQIKTHIKCNSYHLNISGI